MEQFATPIDCDVTARPVMVRAVNCPSRLRIPPHSHGRAELVYVSSGALSLTSADRIFTVATQNALLIPPGTVHDMRVLADTHVLSVYVTVASELWHQDCRSIPLPPLLHELMQAAVGLPESYNPNSRDGRIMDLIREEVELLMAQPRLPTLRTPMPSDARLSRLCRRLLASLDRNWSIDEAALAAGMGRRTFTRAFRHDIGISFAQWLLHARLNAAVVRLNAGASITQVAFECGYNSPSAFATTFKRCLGVPPSDYQATGDAGTFAAQPSRLNAGRPTLVPGASMAI